MRTKRRIGVAAFLLAILATATWVLLKPAEIPQAPAASRAPARTKTAARVTPEESSPAARTTGKLITSEWADLLRWLNSTPKPSPDEIRARLLATRYAWAEMDPHLLAGAIGQLLETGDDVATGLVFEVGPHGFLAGWPTLRVFLLDALVTADPEAAAAIVRNLLDQTTSAEEFATAMRSLTREGLRQADDQELSGRLGQLLGKHEWQASAGFAEALDLVRVLGTAGAAEQLIHWNGNPTLKSMALHEFAAEHPDQLWEPVQAADALEPATRANLMARLNPADPEQLAAIEHYLRSPDRSREDVGAFLNAFPLRSVTTGYRLYGAMPAPYAYQQIAADDRAAQALVNRWLADPALASYRPELQTLCKRLAGWVEQAR
jgi:hypothetical protein